MILVLVEHAAGRPERVSLEALALAARLGDLLGITVEGLLVGADGASAATYLAGTGLARLHLVDDERLVPYAPAAWAAALLEVARGSGAAAIVAGGSDRGNEVLAHVGARSGQPMAANCTAVELVDGRLRIVRQRWAGSLLEDAWLDGTPLLLTVAPHVLGPVEADPGALAPAVVPARPPLDERDLLVRVVERVESGGGGVSLADARVVVGGGRGVGSADGFALLEELAGLLGGAVGVSRVATSLGWRPHALQIGQTGLRIAPDLYIACGISGAIQHIVGCKAAKKILAINTDPEAPIMSRADYAVIGDLHAVIPAIIAELRKTSGPGG